MISFHEHSVNLLCKKEARLTLNIAQIRKDRRVDTMTKWLYACLLDICEPGGRCHLSLRELTRETGISVGKLSESVKLLKQLGYIRANKMPNRSGHDAWLIEIPKDEEQETPSPPSQTTVEVGEMTITVIVHPTRKDY
jgi:hypothetical protein